MSFGIVEVIIAILVMVVVALGYTVHKQRRKANRQLLEQMVAILYAIYEQIK